jgi:PAS domain S-box-containing protein
MGEALARIVEKGRSDSVAARETPFGLDLSLAAFDRVTRIAKLLLAADDALIILIENGVAWRSRDPEGRRFDPRDPAAERVVASGELLWVEDARLDPEFSRERLVAGPPYLRTYVAAPIRLEDGATPGVLATVSVTPQPYDAAKAARLQDLADLVADEWVRARAARERNETADALTTAQSRFQALAETMPISLVMTDPQLRVIAASRTWRSDFSVREGPVGGEPLLDLVPVWQPFERVLRHVLAGGTVGAAPLSMKRPDGTRAWMQAQVMAWRNIQGELAGLVITAHDVTDMKAALDAAERSQERLNLALSLSDIHVWEIDYVGRKLFKAGAEDTFFERPQTYEDLYRDIFVTIDERDHALVKEAWRRHVEEGEPYRPHYRIARTDGKEIWAEGIIQYSADEKGRPQRMVGALRNITSAKQAEQKLIAAIAAAEAANTAKSQFLATMSHEIRTPMNGVLGMAQAMAAEELSPTQRVRLEVIRESGQSLLTILNDVLDISKIEAGKLELEEADFEIDEIAESVRHAFAAIAEAKDLQLVLQISPRAEGVYRGDATRVRQILSNLISNALKFTEQGAVTVSVQRTRERLRLSVSDTGIGIARADMRRLFEKFEQADASTTRRFGGSGLGLAICRQLAGMMGGAIRARSRVGEGTTFVVSLPLEWRGPSQRQPRAAEPAAPATPAEARELRVLAAEDNEINQLVLKTLLGQFGLEPVVVADGEAALEAWEREPWDVILMDVQMPRMDGPTATRKIRRRETELGRPRTPIVALTANAMAHQVEEYRAAGMDAFVAKPIDVAELLAALQAAVDPVVDEAAAA